MHWRGGAREPSLMLSLKKYIFTVPLKRDPSTLYITLSVRILAKYLKEETSPITFGGPIET